MSDRVTVTVRREPGPFTRSLVALSLRVGLGLIFLTAGIEKFEGLRTNKYPGVIVDQFEKTRLRPDLVRLFAGVLPYAEVGLGAALIAGLFTTAAAALAGALLVNLLFGQTVLHNVAMYPALLTYLLVNAAVLWLSPVTSNYLSLDGLLFGWFWAPRGEGPYHLEDAARSHARRT